MKNQYRRIICIILLSVSGSFLFCESKAQERLMTAEDTIHISADSTIVNNIQMADTTALNTIHASFKPNPTRAVIYSAIFPGLGQIYNRKYWKLPLVYGGFLGFIYAVTWNNKNYQDYSTMYLDIMTDDPAADPSTWHKSWQSIVPTGQEASYLVNSNFKNNLKSGKDYYRRYRDLSIILTIAWYFLCMADSYVDAHLFDFDISPDLSMHIEPAASPRTSYSPRLYGLNCSINF